MKTEKEIMDRLYSLADQFRSNLYNKKYNIAFHCYRKALFLVTELDLPESVKKEFFGNRPYISDDEEPVDGLFREEEVLKAHIERVRDERRRLEELEEDIERRKK